MDGRVYGAQALGCCGRLTVEYTACDDGMVLVTIHDCDAHGSDPTSAARDANCQALHPVTQLYLQMAGMVASGSGSLKRTNEVVLANEYNRKVKPRRVRSPERLDVRLKSPPPHLTFTSISLTPLSPEPCLPSPQMLDVEKQNAHRVLTYKPPDARYRERKRHRLPALQRRPRRNRRRSWAQEPVARASAGGRRWRASGRRRRRRCSGCAALLVQGARPGGRPHAPHGLLANVQCQVGWFHIERLAGVPDADEPWLCDLCRPRDDAFSAAAAEGAGTDDESSVAAALAAFSAAGRLAARARSPTLFRARLSLCSRQPRQLRRRPLVWRPMAPLRAARRH